MSKLIYQHRETGEKIQLFKITPSLWYKIENGERVFLRDKQIKEYKFLKKESKVGGWHNKRFIPQVSNE